MSLQATTVLIYLGIETDSDDQVIRLPDDKYSDLHSQLTQWILKKKCTKKELLSLIGKLHVSYCESGTLKEVIFKEAN